MLRSSTQSSDVDNSIVVEAHTLINKERRQQGMATLNRCAFLDRVCQMHAEGMALRQLLSHSVQSLEDLQLLVNSNEAAENIQCGATVENMHQEAIHARQSAYANIMSNKFTEFGVGTAQPQVDGSVYMVQLFRGPEMENVPFVGCGYDDDDDEEDNESLYSEDMDDVSLITDAEFDCDDCDENKCRWQ